MKINNNITTKFVDIFDHIDGAESSFSFLSLNFYYLVQVNNFYSKQQPKT